MKTYIVITDTSKISLELKVNKAIDKGYTPIGGVSTTSIAFSLDISYSQAMIKQ